MKRRVRAHDPRKNVRPQIIKTGYNNMNLIKQVEEISINTKEKTKQYGEVFTPTSLTQKMLEGLNFTDPSKTILDPASGNGNMGAVVATRLMEGLKDVIPDEDARYKHIMEKQLYMCELQRANARNIERIFNPNGDLKLNLYVGDTLRMPEDYFDLTYEERNAKYPQHNVWDDTPEAEMQYPKVKPIRGKRRQGANNSSTGQRS